MKFLLSIIFVLSLTTTNVANAVCSNEDTFDGKASIEYPKSGNVFKKAKATPEMKENTKINAKSKILDAYVNKCLDDRSKVEQYLREKNKIDSQLDKFVTVVRVKEKDNQEKRIYSVKMRGSVNSKIFDTLLYGPGKVKGKGKGKTRMVALFVARKAMGTDSKIYDDKVTKITKAETGVAGEKSVSSDGTTTAVNKQTTAVAKVQKGGSKVKKTRASKREWSIMPSSDLNKNILGVFSKSGYRGMSYKIFAKYCGSTPTNEVEEEFSVSDTLSEDTEFAIFTAVDEAERKRCKIKLFATGTMNVNTALPDKVNGGYSALVSVRADVKMFSEDDLPETVASIGPIQIRANGAEDNEAERNALDKAGKTAAQEIINTLRSAGIN
mgnify:FL=1